MLALVLPTCNFAGASRSAIHSRQTDALMPKCHWNTFLQVSLPLITLLWGMELACAAGFVGSPAYQGVIGGGGGGGAS